MRKVIVLLLVSLLLISPVLAVGVTQQNESVNPSGQANCGLLGWLTGCQPASSSGGTGSTGAQGPAGQATVIFYNAMNQTPNQTAGTIWYTDVVDPVNGLGDNGDFFLQQVSYDIFDKSGGSWHQIMNIKGPQGNPGNAGPQGLQGIQGIPGPMNQTENQTPGAPGATGAAGPNLINASTTTPFSGVICGNGANVYQCTNIQDLVYLTLGSTTGYINSTFNSTYDQKLGPGSTTGYINSTFNSTYDQDMTFTQAISKGFINSTYNSTYDQKLGPGSTTGYINSTYNSTYDQKLGPGSTTGYINSTYNATYNLNMTQQQTMLNTMDTIANQSSMNNTVQSQINGFDTITNQSHVNVTIWANMDLILNQSSVNNTIWANMQNLGNNTQSALAISADSTNLTSVKNALANVSIPVDSLVPFPWPFGPNVTYNYTMGLTNSALFTYFDVPAAVNSTGFNWTTKFYMPGNYNAGVIYVNYTWFTMTGGGTGTVVISTKGYCLAPGASIDTPWGANVSLSASDGTLLAVADNQTGAITLGGTPLAGRMCVLQGSRLDSNGPAHMYLLGMRVSYAPL